MKNIGLSKLWNSLRFSYWFLPSLMAIGGIGLAMVALTLDQTDSIKTEALSWLYQGGPDGARALLSAVAGSMITVAATAFSITIVALQLAAANFGPRLLRNFMRDQGNQMVLGTFIATFLYCLLVLRRIYGEDYNPFVPHISVTLSIVLSFASISMLIYFIHHASTIIQASHVIADVVNDLDKAIERLFPEKIGEGPSQETRKVTEIPQDFESQTCPVKSTKTGYIQTINDTLMLKMAGKRNLLLRLECRPGQFIAKGDTLALVYPGKGVNQELESRLNETFLVGRERTEQQDIEFPFNQLVEIALRALSPGINDPFTAIRCIDRLSAGLSALAQRKFPSRYRYDEGGELRIIAEPVMFERLVDITFNQIRHYGKSDVLVMVRLLDAIAEIASRTHHAHDRLVLRKKADTILHSSYDGLPEKYDQNMIEAHYKYAIEHLARGGN